MILTQLLAAATIAGPGSLGEIWQHIVADFSNLGDPAALATFGSVLMIDLVLAGDNAIVVGALAAGLPAVQRRKVIFIGIGAALVLRIVFALLVSWLMGIVGLIFAGGLLLLWVSWKFWREVRESGDKDNKVESGIGPARSFASAAWAVAVADVSMSLDNVLGVAGAAREHPGILVIGLLLAFAAVVLFIETKGLLIGEAVAPAVRAGINDILQSHAKILAVNEVNERFGFPKYEYEPRVIPHVSFCYADGDWEEEMKRAVEAVVKERKEEAKEDASVVEITCKTDAVDLCISGWEPKKVFSSESLPPPPI